MNRGGPYWGRIGGSSFFKKGGDSIQDLAVGGGALISSEAS